MENALYKCIIIIIILVIFCIATSTFCYSKIYHILRRHQAEVSNHIHQRQPNGGEGIPLNILRYKKTVSSALWVQMTLLACYLPYGMVIVLLAITGSPTPPQAIAWMVTISFVLLNSPLNPFLYCWKMREVRKAVKATVTQFWCFTN